MESKVELIDDLAVAQPPDRGTGDPEAAARGGEAGSLAR
jgi:hypothetical protein